MWCSDHNPPRAGAPKVPAKCLERGGGGLASGGCYRMAVRGDLTESVLVCLEGVFDGLGAADGRLQVKGVVSA